MSMCVLLDKDPRTVIGEFPFDVICRFEGVQNLEIMPCHM
jgi:hypothetical protein